VVEEVNRLAGLTRSAFLQRLAILLVLVFALGLWLRRPVLALYHLEAGGWAMGRAEAFRAAHPAVDNEFLDPALRHFQQAVELAPTDGYAYRRLGQAWLLAGNNDAAQRALSRAAELRPHDPLIHIELGDAWGGLGQAEKAVAEYEQGRYGPATGEAIASYLKLADWRIAGGSGDVALKILQDKVLALDPNNLPALYRVATIYEGMGKLAAASAAPIRTQMKEFPVESVAVPSSPALAGYLAQTMAALTEDGTWTRETLLNVVGYQVWQYAAGAPGQGTEQVLQTLVDRWPADVDVRFYLGEFYHRRGDLDQAEANYRRVLDKDPAYVPASLRLGMIGEVRSKGANEAVKPAAGEQTDEIADRAAVAASLGVPVSHVELGANLLPGASGSAEDEGFTAGWYYRAYLGKDGKSSLFAHATDDLVPGGKSLRIDSLWRKQPEPDARSYAEYADHTFMTESGKYLVAVCYSLNRVRQGAGLVFWGGYDVPGGLILLNTDLPPHAGWFTARFAVDGPLTPTPTELRVRNWSDGSLIVTSVSIRRITMVQPGPTIEKPGS
jgi:tetratricopeptide (TPR) repeat protein